jgi:hypothetical protein
LDFVELKMVGATGLEPDLILNRSPNNQRFAQQHQTLMKKPHPVEIPPRYPLRLPLENAKWHKTAQTIVGKT